MRGGVDPDTQLFLERASEDDRIFCTFDKTSPEILIYEDLSSEKWISEKVLNAIPFNERENIFYSKQDSKTLEKFLKAEGNVETFKNKCVKHSSRCQTC